MTLKKTPCCALLFMTAKDWDSLDKIYKRLKRKQSELNQIGWYSYGKGETTVQCMVLPNEIKLRKNLKKLGFRKKLDFDRRRVSCQLTKEKSLSMYILELKNLKDI